MFTKFRRSGPAFYMDDGLWVENVFRFGGGPVMPPQPDYEAQARAQALTDKQNNDFTAQQEEVRRQEALQDQQRADAQAAQDKADKLSKFRNDLQSAYTGAQGYGNNQLATLGLSGNNDYGILSAFNAALDNARNGVPSSGVDDVGKYINAPTLWDTATKQQIATNRNKLTNQYNSSFGPNSTQTYLPDDLAQPTLDQILSDQQGEAQSRIDAANARGTLTTSGLTAANKELGREAASARNKLTDVGSGVLDKYRKSVNDYETGLTNRISNWNFGDPLNLDTEKGNIDQMVQKDQTRLPGDIYSAVGTNSYFDPDTILGKAGNLNGVSNGPANTLVGAMTGLATSSAADQLKKNQVATGSTTNSGVI